MSHFSLAGRTSRRGTSLLLLTALTLLGCDSRQATPGNQPTARTGPPRIALIMKSLANEFFSTMADGAKRHQSEHAGQYELIVNGIKDELDVARQVALVEEMVAQEVDAIVIAPADSKILVPACKRAQAAGVVVINIDNKLDDAVLAQNQVRIPFVGPDNRAGARLAGEYLGKRLQRGDKVAILEGVRTAFNGQQRLLGFQDAMQTAGVDIVDSQSALWEMDMANKVASAMLSEHPDLKALLCSNDSMALGALAATKAAGRTGAVAIIGYDGISAVEAAVKDGSIVATIEQHADQLAVFGIEYALQVLRGEATPQDKQTPVDLITAETFK